LLWCVQTLSTIGPKKQLLKPLDSKILVWYVVWGQGKRERNGKWVKGAWTNIKGQNE